MWCVWISIRYVTIDSRIWSRGVFSFFFIIIIIHSSSHFRIVLVWILCTEFSTWNEGNFQWRRICVRKALYTHLIKCCLAFWYAKYVFVQSTFNHHSESEQRPPGFELWLFCWTEWRVKAENTITIWHFQPIKTDKMQIMQSTNSRLLISLLWPISTVPPTHNSQQ